ncbi:MAG: hypothetical protein AB7P03_07970 [Kofleriaceae bacterium]
MRSAWLVTLGFAIGGPGIAHADVWKDRYIPCDPSVVGLTTSSHTLYVNDCKPNGCVVKSGTDSSFTDTSSIADTTVTLSPYMHDQAHWDAVIACLRETFAPFDIQVVTDDPGNASHFEVMTAGTSAELNPEIEDAGGIAPFISCNAQRNNNLAFVFANQTSDIPYLCAAIAHEAGHMWGLSHSLDPLDPMTYMDLGSKKTWQNSEQTCGTTTPQRCRCFDDTQNSFRYLNATFGLATDLTDAAVSLDYPRDGQWVRPEFPVRATLASPLEVLHSKLTIDGQAMSTLTELPLVWNAPASVKAGEHMLAISATDFGDRTVTASARVNVMAACTGAAACDAGFHCLGGFCMPGREIDGGLGAACATNGDCSTGTCSSDGTASLCTASCETGNSCPEGFECITGANACWPVGAADSGDDAGDGGGCSTSDGGGLMLVGLGAMVATLTRRRRG